MSWFAFANKFTTDRPSLVGLIGINLGRVEFVNVGLLQPSISETLRHFRQHLDIRRADESRSDHGGLLRTAYFTVNLAYVGCRFVVNQNPAGLYDFVGSRARALTFLSVQPSALEFLRIEPHSRAD